MQQQLKEFRNGISHVTYTHRYTGFARLNKRELQVKLCKLLFTVILNPVPLTSKVLCHHLVVTNYTDYFAGNFEATLEILKNKNKFISNHRERMHDICRSIVGIKRQTSYIQRMQLNVSKFSTCTYKLQIGYIIITT